jgi:hypothetical protein
MANKHTPGPWNPYVTPHDPDFAQEINNVCAIYNAPNSSANARLIASAPLLLEALQALHNDIAEYARINNLGGFDNHCMRQARAAIQKATGVPQ